MFQITIFFLYITAGAAFGASRLPRFAASDRMLVAMAFTFALTGLIWHSMTLMAAVMPGGNLTLSIGNIASIVGLQMALIAVLSAFEKSLRGLAGGMLLLAAFGALWTTPQLAGAESAMLTWQLQAHILISLFAYGLLNVGAIVAIFALIQDWRLRSRRLSQVNRLFAPLETNETLLYGIAAAGFASLLVGIMIGLTFVDDFFAQHLVHKSALSILALALFGVLLAGRYFAGWRGRRAVYLYLWGFLILALAYFGSRFVLEDVLGRSWG